MASTAGSRVRAYIPAKKPCAAPVEDHREKLTDAQQAKEELLDDLMGDVRKCFSTKSKPEKEALALAISKIASS